MILCLGPICIPLWPFFLFLIGPLLGLLPVAFRRKLDSISKWVYSSILGSGSSAPKPHLASSAVKRISTLDEFRALLRSNPHVLVKVTASWCGPCHAIQPFVEELAVKHRDRLSVVSVDVDDCSEVSDTLSIQAMPTFILFVKGVESKRIVGANKSELQGVVERMFASK